MEAHQLVYTCRESCSSFIKEVLLISNMESSSHLVYFLHSEFSISVDFFNFYLQSHVFIVQHFLLPCLPFIAFVFYWLYDLIFSVKHLVGFISVKGAKENKCIMY